MSGNSQLGGRFDEAGDLAMDQVSRMTRAAEQGFTTPMFHGTLQPPPNVIVRAERSLSGQEFNQFNWGTHTGSAAAAEERILVRDIGGFQPDFDTDFTLGAEALVNARIFPLLGRGKFIEVPDLGSSWNPSRIIDEAINIGAVTPAEGSAALAKAAEGSMEIGGITGLEAARDAVTDLLESKGFTGLTYINGVEDAGSRSWMVFNPANLRSVSAAFDPSRIGDPDMMAGLAALIGAGAAGQAARREER